MCDIGIGYVAPRSRGPHPEGDNSGRGLQGRRALVERVSPSPWNSVPAEGYYIGLKTNIGESPGTFVEAGVRSASEASDNDKSRSDR